MNSITMSLWVATVMQQNLFIFDQLIKKNELHTSKQCENGSGWIATNRRKHILGQDCQEIIH